MRGQFRIRDVLLIFGTVLMPNARPTQAVGRGGPLHELLGGLSGICKPTRLRIAQQRRILDGTMQAGNFVKGV